MTICLLVKTAREQGIAKMNGVTCSVTTNDKGKEVVHFFKGDKRITTAKATQLFF